MEKEKSNNTSDQARIIREREKEAITPIEIHDEFYIDGRCYYDFISEYRALVARWKK